jgi:hypothetical protein
MKDNTTNPDKIITEYWETPILDSQYLWLYRQLYTSLNNYFFFNKDTDEPLSPIYVLTLPCRDTFKISDEGDSTMRIVELLKNRKSSYRTKGRSFKVWNSPLAIEVCRSLPIPNEEYKQIEKFQYVILAQDETIEFVTFNPPKWEIHHNILLDELVIQYLRKNSLD